MVVTAEVVIDDEPSGAPLWVWTALSAIACASFWCQATVTEERLVPALNVIAKYYKIPSDIAGEQHSFSMKDHHDSRMDVFTHVAC